MKNSSNIILQSSDKGISRIKLNQPKNYNALSFKMLETLIKTFKKFNNDKTTKVIIIEGLGNGFCAGHDLKEINFLKGKSKYRNLFFIVKYIHIICFMSTYATLIICFMSKMQKRKTNWFYVKMQKNVLW